MQADVKVVKMDELVDIDEAGKIRTRIRVQFKVGEDGPFVHLFAKDGFNGATAQAELERVASELRALRG